MRYRAMGHSQGKPYVRRRALARIIDTLETSRRSSCPPQQACSVPGFHNNKMDNTRQNSIKIPLVHRCIFWARLGSLQGSTLQPVPGILWPNAQHRDGLTHTFDEQERLTGEIRNTRENSKEQGSGTNSLWELRSRVQAGIT
jgi:hypothetical protein